MKFDNIGDQNQSLFKTDVYFYAFLRILGKLISGNSEFRNTKNSSTFAKHLKKIAKSYLNEGVQ